MAISWEKVTHHLGYYTDKVHAGLAYNIAAKRLHGEYAVLNDVPDLPAETTEAVVQRVAKHLDKSFRPRR